MSAPPVIVLFRHDLRVADNPALLAAVAAGGSLLCLFIHDEVSPGIRPLGGASRWWLYHSLAALGASVERLSGTLHILRGNTVDLVPTLARRLGASAVTWNRRYGAAEVAVDTALKAALTASGISATSHNSHLLYEPWTVRTGAGTPFRVFTPFWRAARSLGEPLPPRPAPARLSAAPWPPGSPARCSIEDLGLLPGKPDWAEGLRAAWRPGEGDALARLAAFLGDGLAGYAAGRDRPDQAHASSLSPSLRFGEISPRQVFHAVHSAVLSGRASNRDGEKFLAEIGWREFSYHLLFHFPDLAKANFQPRFDDFPWRASGVADLVAWQRGLTGFPLVDAGMRHLWQTGTLHNRVRMVVASFLVKDLLIDWRAGEAWFWDTLCDADPANNPAGWQWVAGSGADAAPYFRIFNPVKQGETFDPAGIYVRRHVPELAALPDEWIHQPFAAPPEVLHRAGIELGKTYPAPILDRSFGRKRALAALASLNGRR